MNPRSAWRSARLQPWAPPVHRFRPALEQEYQHEVGGRMLRQLRLATVFAFLLVLVQTGWQAYAPGLGIAWVGPFVLLRLIGLGLLAVVAARARPEPGGASPLWLAGLMVAIWLLLLGEALLLSGHPDPRPGFERDWPLFLMVEFAIFGLLRLPFRLAVWFGAAVVVEAMLLGWRIGVDRATLATALWFLLAMYLAGLVEVVRLERSGRRLYLFRRRAATHLRLARAQRLAARGAEKRAASQQSMVEEALRLVETERSKAAEAALLKERFFSAAYHDMQQPLSTINLFARSLARRLVGPKLEAARRDLGVIERATAEIGVMFKGVRDIWELGHYEPQWQSIDLTALMDDLAVQFAPAARDRGLLLRFYRRQRPPARVSSDPMLLKRALANLIQNAIKYTPRGGVLVGFVVLPDRLRVDVCDTGVGIPAAYAGRIFEEYFQVPVQGGPRPGGLGLGLSIVRRIENALPGHRVDLRSVPGRGSRFSLSIPRQLSGGSPAGEIEEAASAAVAVPMPGEGQLLRGRFLVVVENEPPLLAGIVEILSEAGAFVLGARGLPEACEIFEQSQRAPDLLLTDFRLDDGATGLDVIAAMQRILDWAQPIPVLLATGDLLGDATAGRLPPGSAVYRKPIIPDTLLASVQALLARVATAQ